MSLFSEYLQSMENKEVYITIEEGIDDQIKHKSYKGILREYLLSSNSDNSLVVLELLEQNPERSLYYIRERDIVAIKT